MLSEPEENNNEYEYVELAEHPKDVKNAHFLSLTKDQQFRICGSAFDGWLPNDSSKYAILTADLTKENLLSLGFARADYSTPAVHCVVCLGGQKEVHFYLIPDDNDKHSIYFTVINTAYTEEMKLRLVCRLTRVLPLYDDEDNPFAKSPFYKQNAFRNSFPLLWNIV